MKKNRWLALCLLVCFLLTGCQAFASKPEPPASGDRPELPPDAGSASAPPEPLPLPVTDGIDWNAVPSQRTGAGGERPDPFTRPLYTHSVYGYYNHDGYISSAVPDERGLLLTVNPVHITGLRNQILQNRLNGLIASRIEAFTAAEPPARPSELAALAAEHAAASACVDRFISISAYISGRVLSLQLVREDVLKLFDAQGTDITSDWACLGSEQEWYMYDIYDGRQLRLHDLFFDGEDYVSVVDTALAQAMAADMDSGLLKRPFRGLPDDYPYISADGGFLSIWFPFENPYTAEARYFTLTPDQLCSLCALLYEDPAPYLTADVSVSRGAFSRALTTGVHRVEAAACGSGSDIDPDFPCAPRLMAGAPQPVMQSINAALDAFEARYRTLDYLPQEVVDAWEVWDSHNFLVDFHTLGDFFCVQYTTLVFGPDYSRSCVDCLIFDLRTGRRLTAADLLLPSEALDRLLRQEGVSLPLGALDSVMVSFGFDVLLSDPSTRELVFIPPEHFNFACLEGGSAQ